MKKRYYIDLGVPREKTEALRTLAVELRCEKGFFAETEWSNPMFLCTLDEDDPRLAVLRNRLTVEGIKWSERWDYVYAVCELRSAPLLGFRVTTAERDLGGPYREQYDLSRACPRCGTGARQVGPLRVKPRGYEHSGLPKKAVICQTVDEYLITEPLYQAFVSADLSGLELMQVVSGKGVPLAWWQMIPRYELPPMAPETRGVVRDRSLQGCPECGRDNHFGTPEEPPQIAYRRSQLGDGPLPDAAYTYECFGISKLHEPFEHGRIARGLVLVSPKVYDIFRRLKVRGVRFSPVRIIED